MNNLIELSYQLDVNMVFSSDDQSKTKAKIIWQSWSYFHQLRLGLSHHIYLILLLHATFLQTCFLFIFAKFIIDLITLCDVDIGINQGEQKQYIRVGIVQYEYYLLSCVIARNTTIRGYVNSQVVKCYKISRTCVLSKKKLDKKGNG